MKDRRPVAFVTGAAVGIGRAVATRLAQEGYDLVVAALRSDSLEDTANELDRQGAFLKATHFDLADVDEIRQAFENVTHDGTQIDLLVNNAAVPLHRAAIDVTVEEWNCVLDVNLRGTFFMCQEMARHRSKVGRGGRIINMSSTHGLVALNERSTYGISKAGLLQLTRMLAIEWADMGMRVNAVAPATISTPSREAALADPEKRNRMVGRIPLRRFGEAEEVAAAVAYLAAPDSDFITGQAIVLDGGLTAM